MKLLGETYTQRLVAPALCLLLVSGCSSSGDSSPAESQTLNDTQLVAPDNNVVDNESVDNGNAEIVGDDVVPSDTEAPVVVANNEIEPTSVNPVAVAPEPVVPNPVAPESMVPNPVVPEPVVSEPIVPARTQLNVEITVPAYQSNALQVGLSWGEVVATASWVGDEQWSLTVDLPTDMEQLLTVTFSDDNGNLELGSYEQTYRTGFNDAESLQVTADQFDIARWDADGDGISNLDELIAQTDPLVNEESSLEIRDSLHPVSSFVSDYVESRIPDERPYTENFEEYFFRGEEQTQLKQDIDINIDADGNGTIDDFNRDSDIWYGTQRTLSANRINTGNSISWEGIETVWRPETSWTTSEKFTSEVTIVNDRTRRWDETSTFTSNDSDAGLYNSSEYQANLIGELVEGSSLCQAVSGTIEIVSSRSDTSVRPEIITSETTRSITKEIGDQYWRVKGSDVDRDGIETNVEFLVRELITTWQCAFSDF